MEKVKKQFKKAILWLIVFTLFITSVPIGSFAEVMDKTPVLNEENREEIKTEEQEDPAIIEEKSREESQVQPVAEEVEEDTPLLLQQRATKFTVKFDTDGGRGIRPTMKKVTGGQPTTPPSGTLRKSGFIFIAWTLDGEEFDFNTPITSDITLVARWLAEDQVDTSAWTTDDFIYEGTTLVDFSKIGRYKKSKNPNVVIPDNTDKGEPLVAIGDGALKRGNGGEGQMETIVFPKTLERIGKSALTGNKFKEIVFPDSVTELGEGVLSITPTLQKVTLSKNLTAIPKDAFQTNGISNIIIPASVTEIGEGAFSGNRHLRKVIIEGEGLTTIDARAFQSCQLVSIDIPDSVTTISPDAFKYNPGHLGYGENVVIHTASRKNPNKIADGEKFYVDPSDDKKTDISIDVSTWKVEDFTFEGGKVTGLSEEGKVKSNYNNDLVIPEASSDNTPITAIGESAFFGLYSGKFTSLVIPEGVTTIGDRAFQFHKLESVTLPSTVKNIGAYAFATNENLQTIQLPAGLETIGESAFSLSGLTRIDIPEGVKDIPRGAFTMNELTEVVLHEGLLTIGEQAFMTNKLTEINIPASLHTVGKLAFSENPGVAAFGNMVVLRSPQGNNPNGIPNDTSYDGHMVDPKDGQRQWDQNCFEWDVSTITGFSEIGKEYAKTHTDLVIPSRNPGGGLTRHIGMMAFGNPQIAQLPPLTSVVLPEGLETIGIGAFMNNDISGTVIIPEKVKIIPLSCFRSNKIQNLVIRGDLETIDRMAFQANALENIIIPESLTTINDMAFRENPGDKDYTDHVVLRTPSGNSPLEDKENYYVNPGDDKKVVDNTDYTTWLKEDFTYSGTTVTGFSQLGERKIKRNKNLVLPETNLDGKAITKVGVDAFRNLQKGYHIESVKIPNTVVEIENYAFQFNKISRFELPPSVKRVGFGIVMNSGVKELILHEGLEFIDMIAFCWNPEMKEVVIPKSVKFIGTGAFRKNALEKVTFAGEGLEKIDRLAFAENNLTEVRIPASLKEIGFQAFMKNPGLDKYGNVVVLRTPGNNNPNYLPDGLSGDYVVDPEFFIDKDILKEALDLAKAVYDEGKDLHGEKFWEYFSQVYEEGQAIYKEDKPSASKVYRAAENLKWIISRSPLDKAVVQAEGIDQSLYEETSTIFLKDAITRGKHDVMVYNIKDETVHTDEKNIETAIELLVKKGEEIPYKIYEGEDKVYIQRSIGVTDYKVKVRYAILNGKLMYLMDNGTDEYLLSDHELEEHDYPYWRDALKAMMGLVRNLTKKEVKAIGGKAISDATKEVDARTGATISGVKIKLAILKAWEEDEPIVPKPDPTPPPKPTPKPSRPPKDRDTREYQEYHSPGHGLPVVKIEEKQEVKPDSKIIFTVGDGDYTVNGKSIGMDGKPYIKEDRIMLPLRYVAEALGMNVSYDDSTRTATFTGLDKLITINIDTKEVMVNGKRHELEVAPEIINDRLYLPLGLIADILGMTRDNPTSGNDISWDSDTKSVKITRAFK